MRPLERWWFNLMRNRTERRARDRVDVLGWWIAAPLRALAWFLTTVRK